MKSWPQEITRLDAKFMICVAEERGLFGAGAAPPAQARRKKPEHAHTESKRRRRKASFEVCHFTMGFLKPTSVVDDSLTVNFWHMIRAFLTDFPKKEEVLS